MHGECDLLILGADEQRDYLASWLGPLLQESYDIETEEESGVEIISSESR